MFKAFVAITLLHTVLISQTVGSETAGRVKVALLTVKPEGTSDTTAMSYDDLSMALQIELTRTVEFQFVELVTIQEAFESKLIDDAVFELLLTQDLKRSLALLDAFSTESGRRRLYSRTARRLGVRYLIEATCKTDRDRVQVDYRLIDAGMNLPVFARKLAGTRSGWARETAKRMTRDLWRIEHRK